MKTFQEFLNEEKSDFYLRVEWGSTHNRMTYSSWKKMGIFPDNLESPSNKMQSFKIKTNGDVNSKQLYIAGLIEPSDVSVSKAQVFSDKEKAIQYSHAVTSKWNNTKEQEASAAVMPIKLGKMTEFRLENNIVDS